VLTLERACQQYHTVREPNSITIITNNKKITKIIQSIGWKKPTIYSAVKNNAEEIIALHALFEKYRLKVSKCTNNITKESEMKINQNISDTCIYNYQAKLYIINKLISKNLKWIR
jgi:hypothetical protein